MDKVKAVINIATESELQSILDRAAEEQTIKKIAAEIHQLDLGDNTKDEVLKASAEIINNLFFGKYAAEKQSMELDGFLRYMFEPHQGGVPTFEKLADINVETAKQAAEELPRAIDIERRRMLDLLHSDLKDITDYDIKDDPSHQRLTNLYNMYFEEVPDVNDIIATRDKNRQKGMSTDQKKREKDILNSGNDSVYSNRYNVRKLLSEKKDLLRELMQLSKGDEDESAYKEQLSQIEDGLTDADIASYGDSPNILVKDLEGLQEKIDKLKGETNTNIKAETPEELKLIDRRLRLRRQKAQEDGNIPLVKELSKKINIINYKLRYLSDTPFKENEILDAKGNPIPKDTLSDKGIFPDEKDRLIDEANKGISNAFSAAETYKSRLSSKVLKLNDDVFEGVDKSKIKEYQQEIDDINKSLIYFYCAIFDMKLYIDQLYDNSGKKPEGVSEQEYDKFYSEYEMYSELFIETFSELKDEGVVKGFPVSQEFIGRDLSKDINDAEADYQKKRENTAKKRNVDVSTLSVDYSYKAKLPIAKNLYGKSEGNIIEKSKVDRDAIVDKTINEYKNELPLGDILDDETRRIHEKISVIDRALIVAEKNEDQVKIDRLLLDKKKLKQELTNYYKNRGKNNTESSSTPSSTSEQKAPIHDDYSLLKEQNKGIEVPPVQVKPVQTGLTDEQRAELEKALEFDDEDIKLSSIDTALLGVMVRYGTLHSDYEDLLGSDIPDEDTTDTSTEKSDESAAEVEDIVEPEETKAEVKDRDQKIKELTKEIEKRIKQFENKDMLKDIVKLFETAAKDYEKVNEHLKQSIKYEQVQEAINYYKENRQVLVNNRMSAYDISIFDFIKYASSDTLKGLEDLMLKYKAAIRYYGHQDIRSIPGLGPVFIPILNLQSEISKDPIKMLPKAQKVINESIKILSGLSVNSKFTKFIKGNTLSILEDLQGSLYDVDIAQVEKAIPSDDKRLNDKPVYNKGQTNSESPAKAKKEPAKYADALSVLATDLHTSVKPLFESAKILKEKVDAMIEEDTSFSNILFLSVVLGIKSVVTEDNNGNRKFEKAMSLGNSNGIVRLDDKGDEIKPFVVGSIDKLYFYKAIQQYPKFVAGIGNMMVKTAKEIKGVFVKDTKYDMIFGGKIDNLPTMYQPNSVNYGNKVKKPAQKQK